MTFDITIAKNIDVIDVAEEPRNKASANKENPPVTTYIFSPKMLLLLILYLGNKASLAMRYKII